MIRINKKYFSIFNLLLIFVFLLSAGFGCKNPNAAVQEKMKPVTLEYWRTFEDQDAFDEVIAKYRQLHPNIIINYRKFRFEEYKQALLEALAEDRGPDIFSINESWLREYQAKLEPMPTEITMAYQYTKGTIKKEVAYELRTAKTPTLREIKANFADTVYNDAVIDGRVYGLPYALDSLIMLYNKDILNKSGVTQVPKTWKEFQEAVAKTVRFDSEGKIIQAGAALGAGYNIDRSFDVISVLMMQNGAEMAEANGAATFSKPTARDYSPGVEAINFYLDFSNPVKNVYTWNAKMENSLDAFLNGKVAFIFGYNYNLSTIRSRAPKLNLGIAPIPQINPENQVNYANYLVEVVSKKSQHKNEAWDFVIFASQKDNVGGFLAKSGRPTALKELINSQLENEDFYPASIETLTARNWYRGKNQAAAEEAFKQMIESLPTVADPRDRGAVIETAVSRINQTL